MFTARLGKGKKRGFKRIKNSRWHQDTVDFGFDTAQHTVKYPKRVKGV